MIVAVVLLAGAAGGVWLWQTNGGSEGVSQDDLAQNPNLRAMTPPDPDALGFGGGPDAMCGAVEEVMSQRGYQRVTAKESGGGIYCLFITPGVSLLEDGSKSLNVRVGNWRGNAEARYQGFLDEAVKTSERQQSRAEHDVSKVEQFPAGDAGFIFHRARSVRADTDAYFRSGDDMLLVSVWGSIHHVAEDGEAMRGEPLTEEITYREITDIVTALSGDGTPGEPQITEPNLAQHPTLEGLTAPQLPREGTADEVCGQFTAVAQQLGIKIKDANGGEGWSCFFEPAASDRNLPEGAVQRDVLIAVGVHPEDGNTLASEELARNLPRLIRQAAEYNGSPLYEFPIGAGGYAIYYDTGHGFLHAGYLVDNETYVRIEISGWRRAASGTESLTEDDLIADLVTVLTGMGG